MHLDLSNRRAFVGGASRGIGRACAHALAHCGTHIIAAARSEDLLRALTDELPREDGQKHSFLVTDYDKPDALIEAVGGALADGPIHILINNTAGPPGGPIFKAEPEAFEQAFRRHVICNHRLSQLLVPGMKEAGFGRIINIVSTSVKEPIPGLGVSNTIRAAVAAWAKTLSDELAPLGITVNNVLPGFTDTARLKELFENKAEASGKTFKEVEADAIARIPLSRLAQPEEIAGAVAYLASPAAAYITGHSLPVDGGRMRGL